VVLKQGSETKGRAITQIILISASVVALVFIFANYWPLGPDYFYTFRPVAKAFISGQADLYSDTTRGYFASPWGILLISPTLLLPVSCGQALLIAFSLVALVLSVYAFWVDQTPYKPWFVACILALGNLHTFDLLIRGNLDAIPAAGLGVSLIAIKARKPLLLGVGLWLLSVKPVNVLLPILAIIWLTRHWPRRHIAIYLSPVAATFLISLPMVGLDWPLRYVRFIASSPPMTYLQTSLWRGLAYFGFKEWWAFVVAAFGFLAFIVTLVKLGDKGIEWSLALSISIMLFITPYALGSHYVLLAPVFALLVGHKRWLLALWFLTLTPLLRLVGGFEVSWVDIFYPAAIMTACLVVCWNLIRHGKGESGPRMAAAA